jgi:hypothetical protein
MNNLSDKDRGSFVRIQILVGDSITSGRKREFLTEVYVCDDNDGKAADFNACLGGRNLEFNLILACAGRHPNPTPGEVTQEVSRFSNKNHIATSTMQSLIFPPDIISEIIVADHCHCHSITPTSLYACIKAVIRPLNTLDADVVFRISVVITNMNTTTYVNTVDLPPPNKKTQSLTPLPVTTQLRLPNEISLRRAEVPDRNIRVILGNISPSILQNYVGSRGVENVSPPAT